MNIIGIRWVIIFLIAASCLPEQPRRAMLADDPLLSDGTTNIVEDNSELPLLSEPLNFWQKNGEKTSATLSLFSNYNDSFLIRGNQLMAYLEDVTKSYQSNFCLVTNYPTVSGSGTKNILILSARIRSYFSSFLSRREYYLQVDPNNQTINQTDCLNVSLTNKLQSLYGSTNFAFTIAEICPSCNTSVVSNSVRLFDIFANEQNNAEIDYLNLSVVPAIGTQVDSSPVCSVNANCTSAGFNCCLEGQCVNHGQVRAGVDTTSSEYQIALEILNTRPELINNFGNLFYVCPLMVPETSSEDPYEDPNLDPGQQANDLFSELTQLYQCLNPVIDEFSICTKDFANAQNLMNGSAYDFTSEADDLNFKTLNASLSSNNIVQVDYGNVTLFKEKLFPEDEEVSLPGSISLGAGNDNLSNAQIASINATLPTSAINDTLSLYYKIDGTCQKLGSSLARCQKFYVQGQSSTPARSSDHVSGNQTFRLPSYADTGFNVIVEVGGTRISQGTDTWSLAGTSVVFNASQSPVFDNQSVTITYFVSGSDVANLTTSKEAAQTALDDHCACDPNEEPCNLKPISTEVNGVMKVTSYECIYPDPNTQDIPLQETVYVSAKAVPHKFYDENGANFDLGDVSSGNQQEGTAFQYDNGNDLKPNNMDSFIGFNEIYGTMNLTTASPVPPKVVAVENGTIYDLFVDAGSFSTCLKCGTDYFSGLQKIFPNNFQYQGGGYLPDFVESRRRTNQGDYPADDFRFGRACFVPASMIPWTHVADSNVTEQRRNRLAAQHILFANGYNKDWYGFDYGALIGSFDGVKWFAIGNQRRIEAESDKLYLAVNAYFGDLTINNTFKVTISEMTPIVNSGSLVTHDLDSDGAQCQRMHICDSDEDCITQLGYDYTCQSVGGMQTSWPLFDGNGNEVSGSRLTSLLSLVGGSNGENKRCVYRGVGAACEQLTNNINTTNSYIGSSNKALHTCSLNSFCASLNSSQFNTKIARFAESPANQNVQSFITQKTDTFGLAARLLGRPYNYYGNEIIPTSTRTQLQTNNIEGLCVPGKDVDSASTTEQLNYLATGTREADKINNVGRTMDATILQDELYLSACPATDEDGDYTHFNNINLDDDSHRPYAIKNNLSSNSLLLDALQGKNLFNDDSTRVEQLGLHRNTCLRAPGSKCFSDFECAPNQFVASAFKSITNFNGEISEAEEKFWEEELVCANSQARYQTGSIFPNPFYETFEHRCCRETDKVFTYFSQEHIGSDFKVENTIGEPLIPGVNQDYNDPERYSRTHTIYDKLITEPNDYPNLVVPAKQPGSPLNMSSNKLRQYKTLHLHNERMCCTGHWVRNFSTGSNGNSGGHKQLPSALQNFDIFNFRPLSWLPNNDPPITNADNSVIPFVCTSNNFQTPDCEVRNITEGSLFERKHLAWLGKLELIGIPQVLIETNQTIYKPVADGDSPLADQSDAEGAEIPLEDTIKDVNDTGIINATFGGEQYYSAADYDNFEIGAGQLKRVFSENEFHCCLPTGVEVPSDTIDSACCTGKVAANDDGINRCCLEDFTDLTVFTNRYVSSEGAFFGNQAISDAFVDPLSGYLDTDEVIKMASSMCCSGVAATGVAIGNYFIPPDSSGTAFPGAFTRRFLYDSQLDDASEVGGGVTKFNAGLRWNNHVYCVPAALNDDGGGSGSGAVAQ